MPDVTLTIVQSTPVNLTIAEQAPVNLTLGGGASAYQIWLDAGNTGTEQDFLDSLVGATGSQGPQGEPGTGASDALGTGFTDGGGSGTIPGSTDANIAVSVDWNGAVVHDIFDAPSYYQTQYADGFPQVGRESYNSSTGQTAFYGFTIDQPYNFTAFAADATSINGIVFDAENGASIFSNEATFSLSGAVIDMTANQVNIQNALAYPVQMTSAAAPNNTIFYSTTLSKLAYKDPGGTVNALY